MSRLRYDAVVVGDAQMTPEIRQRWIIPDPSDAGVTQLAVEDC